MGRIMKFLWLGARVGMAGGAVYALNEQKVWSPQTDTDKIYSQLQQAIPQECSDVINTYITPYLPSQDYFHLNLNQHWNNGVLFTFQFLANFPEHCRTAVHYTVGMASQVLSSVSDGGAEPAKANATAAAPVQEKCDCPEEK